MNHMKCLTNRDNFKFYRCHTKPKYFVLCALKEIQNRYKQQTESMLSLFSLISTLQGLDYDSVSPAKPRHSSLLPALTVQLREDAFGDHSRPDNI